jgi:MFS family permease
MGIYMNSISGGNTIGPLICGFVVQSLGWRWHKWIAVIFTAINFFAVLLFVPETRFNRDVPKSLGATTSDQAIESSSEEDVDVEKTGSPSVKPVPGLYRTNRLRNS